MANVVNLISPQIYVSEEDQTLFNNEVTGATAAIVLRNTYKGRENDTILIANEAELIAEFGKPTNYTECYRDVLCAAGYLQDSNSLYCTRVMPDAARFAGTIASVGTSATFTAYTSSNSYGLGSGGGEISDPDLFADEVAVSPPSVMAMIAAYRGYSGNRIRVAVCDKTAYDAIKQKQHGTWATYSAIYSADSQLATDNNFLILVQECAQGTDPTIEANWGFVETFNVSTMEGEVDDVGAEMFVETKVNENSNYIRVSLATGYKNVSITNFSTSVWQVFAGGLNTDHDDVDIYDPVSYAIVNTALDLYANAEANNLDVMIDSDKPYESKVYMGQLFGQTTGRKDAMAVLDCPYAAVVNNAGSEEADLQTWSLLLYNSAYMNNSYIAAYGNWLDVRDKYNNKYRWIPASGHAAGIYARCANTAEVWSVPAGLNRGIIEGVRRLAWNPSLAQRDHMYKHNVNPIVSFAGQGKVVWGQKTLLNKDSAFNRVGVRRLFLTLEKRVSDRTRYYMHEPNTPLKRQALVSDLDPIFMDAKGKQGVEAYTIVCNETNNTPERVRKGELWVDIFVQPAYASEFIRLNFIATKTGVVFSEV